MNLENRKYFAVNHERKREDAGEPNKRGGNPVVKVQLFETLFLLD